MLHLKRQSIYKKISPKTRQFVDDYLLNVLNIDKFQQNYINQDLSSEDCENYKNSNSDNNLNNSPISPSKIAGNISKIINKKKFENRVVSLSKAKEGEEIEQDVYFEGYSSEFMNFLFPVFEENLHDGNILNDMPKAIKYIVNSILSGETVCIYGDYDCDGVPGTALMRDFFEAIKYEEVIYYIPDRHKEGYGLNIAAIDKLIEQKVKLLITLDLGITNINEIKYAKDKGITAIVTDHHLPVTSMDGEILPEAYAILNPKLANNKYKNINLCGSGVIYKLICELVKYSSENNIWKIGNGFTKWILDLVALSTVADMMSLTGENRTLVIYGMHVMQNTRREGLRTLIKNAKADINKLTETDIAFTIAPRINAASRMKHPIVAFNMLSQNMKLGIDSAHELEELNSLRKETTKNIMKKVYKVLDERVLQQKVGNRESEIIVIGDSSWNAGVLGIIASQIVDKYGKSTFVYGGLEMIGEGKDRQEIYKGSARSNGKYHLVKLMRESEDSFLHLGGHSEAAGFSIETSQLMELDVKLNNKNSLDKSILETWNKNEQDDKERNKKIFEIDLEDVTSDMLMGLSLIGPFGIGNEKPVFRIKDLISFEFVRFGKAKEHIKVMLHSRNTKREAIAFFTDHEKEKTLNENFHKVSFELEPGYLGGAARLKIV